MRILVALIAATILSLPARADTVCTLILDASTADVLVEEGNCQSRVTPASTFKVALAVMAYDAGVLMDAHDPVMAFQPGDPDWGGANWTRDTDPTDWMRFSVLWYSQRITHAMGQDALTQYAQAFDYGNADFSVIRVSTTDLNARGSRRPFRSLLWSKLLSCVGWFWMDCPCHRGPCGTRVGYCRVGRAAPGKFMAKPARPIPDVRIAVSITRADGAGSWDGRKTKTENWFLSG